MESIIMVVLMCAMLYFFMIRPENKRKKETENMRNSLAVGDDVTTTTNLYVPAGALRTVMGKVQGVEANSVVRKIDGNYYEMAKMDVPAGYQAADYGVRFSEDTQEQNLYFINEDASCPVNNVYVSGVIERTGEEMLNLLQSTFAYEMQSEGKATEIAGHSVNYMYAQAPVDSADPVEYYASLVMYVDTIRNSSIMLNLSSSYMAQEALPTEEEMLSYSEGIFSMLKLP